MIRAAAIACAVAIAAPGCKSDACKQRIAAMEERLALAESWSIGEVVGVDLLEVSRERASTEVEPALWVAVGHDRVELEGRSIDLAELDVELPRLITKSRHWQADRGGPAITALLSIDRRAPMDRVREVVAQFDPDDRLRLVVSLGDRVAVPRPPERVASIIDRLRGATSSRRAELIAEKVGEAIAGCEAAARVFAQMGAVAPAEKVRMIRRDLPRAVHACGCKTVDVPLLEGMLLAAFHAYSPARGWIALDRARLATAANAAALL